MTTMDRKRLTEPSPSDWERWVDRLLDGEEPSQAARAEGQTCTSFRKQDALAHAEALALSREIRAGDDREYVRNKLRDNIERAMQAVPVYDREGNDIGVYTYRGDYVNKALELLGQNAGMFGQTQHVEIEHTGGVEVVVEHDYERILSKLAEVGLVSRGPAAALDAADLALLPARTD